MVASGTGQIAFGALSGWALAALIADPKLQERLGIEHPVRLRQAHLDIIIMGGLVTAAGATGVAPDWARRAAVIGAWTNSLLFVPLAFDEKAPRTRAYQLASIASFTITSAGWVGIARAARRSLRRRSDRS